MTKKRANDAEGYPPLESITRPTVDTAQAAYYLNRRPQTLRVWACDETGPIRPRRVFGRLAWPVAEIRAIMEGGLEPSPVRKKAKYFINHDAEHDMTSINDFRQPDGIGNSNVAGLVVDIASGASCWCPLDGAKDYLLDDDLWDGDQARIAVLLLDMVTHFDRSQPPPPSSP